VTARSVVNATGPWVDDLAPASGGRRLIGGTKGAHIVVSSFSGAPRAAIYAEAPQDQRPFFLIPWNGLYLIGTTDCRFVGDPSNATATNDEVRYLLDQANAIFPCADLDHQDIHYAYAGIRPLPCSERGPVSAITRRHAIVRHESPHEMVYSVVGGKLTTYRALAEQVTDNVLNGLNLKGFESSTASVRLPGAATPGPDAARLVSVAGISEEVASRLKRIYGSRWENVVEFAMAHRDTCVLQDSSVLRAEIAFAAKFELAQTLEDVLMRRTMVGLAARRGLDSVDDACRILGTSAGWSAERQREERDSYVRYVARLAIPDAPWNGHAE
jgi:glycerol-3-phosphate dehydrogenase